MAVLLPLGLTAPTKQSPGADGMCQLGFPPQRREVDLLEKGEWADAGRAQSVAFLQAGLIQRRRELAFLQAGLIQPTLQEDSRTFCKKRKRQVYGTRNATADIAGNATYDSDV